MYLVIQVIAMYNKGYIDENPFKREEVITVLMACSSLIRIQVDKKERFLATIKWLIHEKLLSSLIY